MNHTKLVFFAVIICSNLLIGCANNAKVNQLSSDIQTLNEKVDQVSNDMNIVRSDIQSTKDAADRANQRLDNQIHSYRK